MKPLPERCRACPASGQEEGMWVCIDMGRRCVNRLEAENSDLKAQVQALEKERAKLKEHVTAMLMFVATKQEQS